MNQMLSLKPNNLGGTPLERMKLALEQLKAGGGVIVLDDEDRENEADLIFSAQHLTESQMAMMIRDGSGIVCLCLSGAAADHLALPPMVEHNTSQNQTGFTVSIEAREGVTTGVSAADRVTTIRAATAIGARAEDLARPGHIFPLRAHDEGVLGRRGHTEATIDLVRLAGLSPAGVLCELMNPDGTMARLSDAQTFANKHALPILTIADIVSYRQISPNV
ncbi:3,4-dihydroxy-2-butanone-4-phosphate synthase [Neptunomonas marina]|uniref:3,4-dihydroxy-2-butanone 4-phosphate synthase n=1 Tax=Neptunomonas marina TaxID=1815562 RepID=A0A437Q772_9GAMM|nr:3,4-dihydroxy-2-butanone-4-phosphate synthase [Neptunomonas marina]RVU30395.1 3,4-dihydroxy-2-butanone-4-phosphate synthase [Neptunomonas marina]